MNSVFRWVCVAVAVSTLVPVSRADDLSPDGRTVAFTQGKAVMFAVWREDGWWYVRTTTDARGGNKQFNTEHGSPARLKSSAAGWRSMTPTTWCGKESRSTWTM